MKVVYIKTAFYGDFIFQDGKMIPAGYFDFKINHGANENDLQEAKEFMIKNKLTCDSIELVKPGV